MNLEINYDVAISFAGEDRTLAEDISYYLNQYGVKTFYDKDEKANLFGEDLYIYLTEIYSNQAKYCIVLVSKYYKDKLWTNLERRAIQARVFKEQGAYLLPVILDDTEVPGILPTIGHLKCPPEDARSIAQIVFEKLNMSKNEVKGASNMKEPKEFSLRAFQQRLEFLYENVNKNHTNDYLYSYLSRSLGYLCKSLTTNDKKEADFIRPISWLFTIASRFGVDVQKAFIERFPDCCPHCLERKCICMKTGRAPKQYTPAFEVRRKLEEASQVIVNSGKKVDFDSAIKTISSIYYSNEVVWHFSGPWFHISKLYEEVSEVHEAISKFSRAERSLRAVSDEIAEVLAWILSAWDITKTNQSLNQEIINYYFKGCPVCRRSICICRPHSNRLEGLVNPEDLVRIKDKLKELRESVSSNQTAIDELITSITSSIDSQSESLMRLTLAQINYKLNSIEDSIPKDNELSRSLIISIFEYIRRTPARLL